MNIKLKDRFSRCSKSDFLICVSLFLFTIVEIDGRTSAPILTLFSKLFVFGSIGFIFLEMYVSRIMSKKQILLFMIITLLIIIDFLPSGLHMLLYLFLVIWGTRDCNRELCLKFEISLIFLCTVAIVVMCKIGIYNDIVSEQIFNGTLRQRHSLGFSSWTILPFQYLSLVMYYIYLKKGCVKIITYILLGGIGYAIYKMTDTKSALGYLLALIVICWFLKFVHIKHWKRLHVCTLLPWLISIASFAAVVLYRNGNRYFEFLNKILNKRLYYTMSAIDKYGIHFLSFGSENMFSSNAATYLVVDNSYLYYMLKFGVLGLILILCIYSCIIHIAIKRKDKFLLFIIIEILLVNIMWQRLLSVPDFAFLIIAGEIFSKQKTDKCLKTRGLEAQLNDSFCM